MTVMRSNGKSYLVKNVRVQLACLYLYIYIYIKQTKPASVFKNMLFCIRYIDRLTIKAVTKKKVRWCTLAEKDLLLFESVQGRPGLYRSVAFTWFTQDKKWGTDLLPKSKYITIIGLPPVQTVSTNDCLRPTAWARNKIVLKAKLYRTCEMISSRYWQKYITGVLHLGNASPWVIFSLLTNDRTYGFSCEEMLLG